MSMRTYRTRPIASTRTVASEVPLPLSPCVRRWLQPRRVISRWSTIPGVKALPVTALLILILASVLLGTAAQEGCVVSSQPNPIAQEYPDTPTGTFNTTLAIIPLPLSTARQLIPPQYAILDSVYRALLPNFPVDMYPVLMQAGLDHDIQLSAYSITIKDFQRFGWSFPFVDLLGDGYSSFTWAPAQMISAENEIAINGSRDYGTTVHAAGFEPGCDAYGRLASGSAYFKGNATDGSGIYAMLEFAPLATGDRSENPFPIEFYQNVTNQPIFADGQKCDRQVRLFNSTLNQGRFEPIPVRGSVLSNLGPLGDNAGLRGVFGVLIDTPFVEYNGLDCASLKGYSGTGAG